MWKKEQAARAKERAEVEEERINQLRRAIYGDVVTWCEKIKGALVLLDLRLRASDIDFFRSTNKLDISLIRSELYDSLKTEANRVLPATEAARLEVAYFQLKSITNALSDINLRSFDNVEDAKRQWKELRGSSLHSCSSYINQAFEDAELILNKLDGGEILKNWRDTRRKIEERRKRRAERNRLTIDK